MSLLDVTNKFPWREIRDVTVDGEEMVFIPKIYVKNTTIGGNPAWFICGTPKQGYHLHPAFIDIDSTEGTEAEHGILIGKYRASGSVNNLHSVSDGTLFAGNLRNMKTYISAKNVTGGTAEQTGWHLYNIFEHNLILRLALIENGPSIFISSSNVSYLGIQYYKYATGSTWLEGIGVLYDILVAKQCCLAIKSKGTWHAFRNLSSNISSYINTVYNDVGDDYDLGDIFIGKTFTSTESKSLFKLNSYSSFAYISTGASLCSYTAGFGMRITTTGNNNDYYCRIAKFC